MNKFKVGDPVVMNTPNYQYNGLFGTISEVIDNGYWVELFTVAVSLQAFEYELTLAHTIKINGTIVGYSKSAPQYSIPEEPKKGWLSR